jgi:general L-amino acid transport system permease protein
MNKENIKNWLKVNLFSNWYNSIISLFVLFVFFSIIPSFIDWAIIKATFIGKTKADCKTGGACWVFISVWFEKFIYGFYPDKELWRVNLAFIILILTVVSAFFVKPKIKPFILFFLIFIFPEFGEDFL